EYLRKANVCRSRRRPRGRRDKGHFRRMRADTRLHVALLLGALAIGQDADEVAWRRGFFVLRFTRANRAIGDGRGIRSRFGLLPRRSLRCRRARSEDRAWEGLR